MSDFGLNEIIERVISGRLEREVFTALPGIVIDNSGLNKNQSIVVRPAINKVYNADIILESPLLFKVPVVFPAGGGGSLTFPIKNGDTVLLVFSKRNIDDWLVTDGKEVVTPSRNRVFSLSDAIAIPGLFTEINNTNPSADDVELKFKNMSVKLEADTGDMTLSPAEGKSLKIQPSGEVLHHSGAKITDDGDFVTSDGVSLRDHLHDGSETAPSGPISETGAPIPA